MDRRGTPWFGIIVSTIVASLPLAFSYSGKTGLEVFTYLVLVLAGIPIYALLKAHRERVGQVAEPSTTSKLEPTLGPRAG